MIAMRQIQRVLFGCVLLSSGYVFSESPGGMPVGYRGGGHSGHHTYQLPREADRRAYERGAEQGYLEGEDVEQIEPPFDSFAEEDQEDQVYERESEKMQHD